MDRETEQKLIELISQDPTFILLIKNKYLTEQMWKLAIEAEPALFQHMKNPSEEMVLFALGEDGANIKYLQNMGITITPKFSFTAVHNFPGAIFLIPKEFRTMRLKEFACKLDNSLLREFRMRDRFVDKLLEKNPSAVRFLQNPTEDQLCEAIRHDPNICVYIEHITPRIANLINELYPEIASLIPSIRKMREDGLLK